MKTITKFKITVDLLMTIGLLASMSYLLIGEEAHEWIGMANFTMFILHNILNWRWYRSLFRGKYTAVRILQTVVTLLTLLCMIGLMASAIILSVYVLDLQISGFTHLARLLHMLAAYWGFAFMSLHLGLHWGMLFGMIKRAAGQKEMPKATAWGLRLLGLLIALYGVHAFIKYNLWSYMSLQTQFVFFDVEQPLLSFFADYTAMMVLWAWVAHYLKKLTERRWRKSSTAD